MKKIIFLSFLNNIITWSLFYTPFTDKKKIITNTIYGTGNRLTDTSYKSYCVIKCKKEYYSNEFCCSGSNYATMNCLSKEKCKELENLYKNYIIKVAFASYFTLILITMIIIFLLFFWKTEVKHLKIKNAVSASIIVFFSALIIPIIIIKIYCYCKKISLSEFFGSDFRTCFPKTNFFNLNRVEIKENYSEKNNEE